LVDGKVTINSLFASPAYAFIVLEPGKIKLAWLSIAKLGAEKLLTIFIIDAVLLNLTLGSIFLILVIVMAPLLVISA
jgi:hypothetical protein